MWPPVLSASPGIPGMGVNANGVKQLPLKDETKRKILYENANRLLFTY